MLLSIFIFKSTPTNMRRTLKSHCLPGAIVILLSVTGCSNGYTRWQTDVKVDNMSFDKLRYSVHEEDTSLIIARLKSDSEIRGIPCRAGWIHFDNDWTPAEFCLSRNHTYGNVDLPGGAWVLKHPQNEVLVVVFPDDTLVQGHHVRGGGGMNGVHTSFYFSGGIRQYFPVADAVIDNIKCRGGIFHPVTLHENGRLMSCTLGEDMTVSGTTLNKGTKIKVDTAGGIITGE